MKMGIAGAALATVISQCVSAILVTWSLTRAYDAMKLKVPGASDGCQSIEKKN